MLINFTFSNFKSYRSETEFSMVACEDITQDSGSLLTIPSSDELKLLPLAAIYGGNAAGKTSFTQALLSLKHMVCEGKVEYVMPFRLDEESRNTPSYFEIVIACEGDVWKYALSVFGAKVVNEKLTNVSVDQRVYIREGDGSVHFNADYFSAKSDEEIKMANVMAGSIPQESILLTELRRHQGVLQDMARICDKIFHWFYHVLQIKDPGLLGPVPSIVYNHQEFSKILAAAGTGISSLSIRKLTLKELGAPVDALVIVERTMKEGEVRPFGDAIITKENGELYAYKCGTEHVLPSGKIEQFELREESEGTKSFINLLPILNNPAARPHVYVIDELDRSLHTKLSRRLIERHLEMVRAGVPQQLIFTTHDVLLMDDELMRKDEIWLVDRYTDGTSELKAFVEYKEAESETNIRRSYMQGRMGGVPDINL